MTESCILRNPFMNWPLSTKSFRLFSSNHCISVRLAVRGETGAEMPPGTGTALIACKLTTTLTRQVALLPVCDAFKVIRLPRRPSVYQ